MPWERIEEIKSGRWVPRIWTEVWLWFCNCFFCFKFRIIIF